MGKLSEIFINGLKVLGIITAPSIFVAKISTYYFETNETFVMILVAIILWNIYRELTIFDYKKGRIKNDK